MSNLSDLLPAGAGGKQVNFVASGTLPSGQTVALKTDGTVSAISATGGTLPESVGTPAVFESATSHYNTATYDSTNNKVVVAYMDQGNSSYGTAVVGTVSGLSITFGTPVVFETSSVNSISSAFDSSNGKIVISYRDVGSSSAGTAVVGTVSGTSITFGTPVVFNGTNSANTSAVFDSNSNKVVISWSDINNSFYGTSKVGTVSGTSISFGSAVVFRSAFVLPDYQSSAFDSSSNKVVIAYRYVSNPSEAIVGTVSGTSISFGTPVALVAGVQSTNMSATFDSNSNKVVITYVLTTTVSQAVVGTVSGTSISFGSAVTYAAASTTFGARNVATFDSNSNKVVITYAASSSTTASVIVGTVSGTSISFGTPVVFESAAVNFVGSTYDSTNNKVVIVYEDDGNSSYGTGVVFQTAGPGPNNTDFIGITDAAISSAASGSVTIKGGISSNVSSLTPNATYYVQADGRLASGVEYTPYSISGAAYSNRSFSIVSQDTAPAGLAFNSTGTKMFIVGTVNDTVFQYSLSAAYDISSASYDSVSFSVSAQDTTPYGLAFNPTGTKMFIVGSANDAVFQYSLSSAFDLSSASYDSVTLDISAQSTGPFDITFNNDGTKFYIANTTGLTVLQYSMSSAYNLATASYDSVSFSTSPQDSNSPRSVAFNGDGTKMFITGQTSNAVYQYSLSSAFNVSTASYDSINFSVTAQGETNLGSVIFNSSGTAFYALGFQLDTVLEYSTTALAYTTTVLAGKALSSTSINLDYTT